MVPLLARNVPTGMQGIRLAGRIQPQSLHKAANALAGLSPHPVRGGVTRNAKVWIGNPISNTLYDAVSIEAEKKPNPTLLLAVLGVVIYFAAR